MTTQGLRSASQTADHEILPVPDSCYRTGAGNAAGTPADLLNPLHYPVEAVCSGCGRGITCRVYMSGADGSEWAHRPD